MKSPRLTSISLQESLEQSYIENVITLDFHSKKVVATLPFIKDPVEFLSKKHGSDSNYRQAKRIYLAQCKKPSIVAMLERHSARHGVPSVYVDCGTQLMALKHVRFSIRDADTQLYDSLGIRVHVSNAKAHSERGRVERKIRSLREMLERMGIKTTNPMTSIQWET